MNDYLITGGSGRLGTELKKYLEGFYPTHKQLDVNGSLLSFEDNQPKAVVHMAAYTDVDKAEQEKDQCVRVNVMGTLNMLETFGDSPFVFISTEHAEADGTYFKSKLIGELLVKALAPTHLIIRTLFKPNPYPHEYAFIDQMTQGDYVDIIAPLIAQEIKDWDKKTSKTIFVGTGRKSMYELAKRTKPEVKPNSVKDLDLERPTDYL